MELVVGVSAGTVRSVMGKLGGLLAQEYTLIGGVQNDLRYINDELTSMQCCLLDFSAVQRNHCHRMKDWMRQIRDITYDIEDCIDHSSHRLHPLHPSMCCYVLVNPIHEILTWRPRRDVATMISVLKLRAQQISERRERYGLSNLETNVTEDPAHSTTAEFEAADNQDASLQFVTIKDPVGVEDYMKELEHWVTDDKNSSGVLYVVGPGGAGKTTIATAMYRKFGGQFDNRAMVTVSQSSHINAVLAVIKNQFMPQSSTQMQQGAESVLKRGTSAFVAKCFRVDASKEIRRETKLDRLKKDLAEHSDDKSYLVLVDDVWSATAWDQIRKSLPPSNKRTRIIVTTRFQAVATRRRGEEGDHTHKVSPLDVDESERLFKQAFFESKGSEIDKVPKEVWKMCRGLPLAIVIMAGHVACNPNKSEDEWSKVCNSLFPQSRKDQSKDLTKEEVGRIISHCYNDMPVDIKTCSLHLSIFPKGHKISRKRLMRRWKAEGLFSGKQGLNVEEVVDACFNHLIRRKIIQPVEYSSNGNVKNCIIQDMVIEHILAKSREDTLITVVGGNWLPQTPNSNVRWLSLQESFNGCACANDAEKMNLSHVRSLTIFGSLNQLPSHSFKFGIIRFLDLQGCVGFKPRHIKEICEMLLLKYLSLRRTDTKQLPETIGKLENLETLDIRETSVVELPKTVCQLERLVNILGGDKRTSQALKLPEELSKKRKMKALRILSGIEIVGGLADLHHLTKLRKLAIYKLSIMGDDRSFRDLSSSIEYLGQYSLQTLIIDDESSKFINSLNHISSPPTSLVSLELSGKIVNLPRWITQLSALSKLTLSVTALGTDNLLHLSNLEALFSLTFSFRAEKQDSETLPILAEKKLSSDEVITIPDFGFKSLKLLRIFAPLLPVVRFSKNAMPELERLELRFRMLEGLCGVENLAGLEVVHLMSEGNAGEQMKEVQREVERAVKSRTDGKAPKIILDQ